MVEHNYAIHYSLQEHQIILTCKNKSLDYDKHSRFFILIIQVQNIQTEAKALCRNNKNKNAFGKKKHIHLARSKSLEIIASLTEL